jgi:predicted extracellular nuclease
MALRIATFNAENILQRFDFSGFRNALQRDRTLQMINVDNEAQYRALEQARVVAHTDDKMQLTALAIADTGADIVCLQEVESLEALKAFEYGYLFKMVGSGYRHKYLTEGNDGRGIDVAVMCRDETADGDPIEFVRMQSHAHLTYGDLGLFDHSLKQIDEKPGERIFRRDCLEIDLRIGGVPLTLYVVHFKSMGPGREGIDGREWTAPIRRAEARAVRHLIEQRFGKDHAGSKNFLICGDCNDYSERIVVTGTRGGGYGFEHVTETDAGFMPLFENGFGVNLVERLPPMERWTLFHSRGPQEQHLCQLDYIIASPAIAQRNATALPSIIRSGQPWRTPFPPGQEVARYPRVGWDRPKASDHCPVAVTLSIA